MIKLLTDSKHVAEITRYGPDSNFSIPPEVHDAAVAHAYYEATDQARGHFEGDIEACVLVDWIDELATEILRSKYGITDDSPNTSASQVKEDKP